MDIEILRRRRGQFQLIFGLKEDGSLDIKLFCEEVLLFYELVVDQRYIKNHQDMATLFASPKDLQYTLVQLFEQLDISAEGSITLKLGLQAAKINMTKVYVFKLEPSAEGELEYLRRKFSELKQESEQLIVNKDLEIESLIADKMKMEQTISLRDEEIVSLEQRIQGLNEDIQEWSEELEKYKEISNSQREAKIRLENMIETSKQHLDAQEQLLHTLQNQQQTASFILNRLSASICETNPHLYYFHYRYSSNGLTVTKKSQNGWSNFISGWAIQDSQTTKIALSHFKMRDGSLAVGIGSQSAFLNGSIEHPQYVAYFCRDGRIYDSGVRRVNGKPIVSEEGVTVIVNRENATVAWQANGVEIGRANLSVSMRAKRLYLIVKVFWKQDEFTLQC